MSAQGAKVRSGLDVIVRSIPPSWRKGRVGLVSNTAATTADLVDAARALKEAGANVVALFAPEHGYRVAQAAGEPVGPTYEPRTGLPVYSLYNGDFAPPSGVLNTLTHLVVDLPDVGARFYTYMSTLIHTLRSAAAAGIPVTVLDRPNPLTGVHVEGPVLRPAFRSFVGMLPVPIRHGLTLGELARLANSTVTDLNGEVEVIPAQGWRRHMWFDATGRIWVPPSPNMPHFDTALVYPGTCLFEGTTLSEGRGTPTPFQVIGAPWMDGDTWEERLNRLTLPGVRFRSVTFIPCAGKYAHQTCYGVQVHVTDRDVFQPVHTAIAMLVMARDIAGERVAFVRDTVTTYVFDHLVGTDQVRQAIEAGHSWETIVSSWQEEETAFRCKAEVYHLYPE